MKEIFKEKGIIITEDQNRKFHKYYQLLVEWNKKINLTAITEYEEVVEKHFIDSALISNCPFFLKEEKGKILDLGTGAGFPGIVLAVLYPDCQFTLVDSLKKRIDFLDMLIQELNIKNVTLFHARAEDLGRKEEFRDKYDFVLSRAVAELPVLMEYCVPFVKAQGYFVAYKGKKYKEELVQANHACEILKTEVVHIEECSLRKLDEKRYLIFMKKREFTDIRYPRKAGKPKKQPL